jgi:hypothetical protein
MKRIPALLSIAGVVAMVLASPAVVAGVDYSFHEKPFAFDQSVLNGDSTTVQYGLVLRLDNTANEKPPVAGYTDRGFGNEYDPKILQRRREILKDYR